ncbi:DMT family transporter, partial [Candidatus Uhrbacteria bacterium]|nr:DMT family transporter [Candidatus Uhrbacteria bacterium]
FNALRFTAASVFFAAFLRGIPLPAKRDIGKIIGLSLLGQFVYQTLFISGLFVTSAGNTGLILGATPAITAFVSAVVAKTEKVSATVWCGLALALAGIGMIVSGRGFAGPTSGDSIMAIAAVAFGMNTAFAKRLATTYGGLRLAAWCIWISTPVFWLIALRDAFATDWQNVSVASWLWVAYAGVLSIGVAFVIWFRGTAIVGAVRTGVYQNLIAVLTLLIAWGWLRESVSVLQIAGGAAVIAGFWITRAPSLRTSSGR